MLEILSGTMSLLLHDLAKDDELQEKLRNSEKVQFDLEGIPSLDWQKMTQSTLIDSLINGKLAFAYFR